MFVAQPSGEKGQLMFKGPELPDGFQGRVFKGNIRGEGCRVCDQLIDFLLFCGEVTGDASGILIINLLVPACLGSSACAQHVVTILHLRGGA